MHRSAHPVGIAAIVLTLLGLTAACDRNSDAGARSSRDDVLEPRLVRTAADTFRIEPSLNRIRGGETLEPDLRVSGLTFPTDVAELAGDSFAVLDRMERRVRIFDREGEHVRDLGGEGEGPGEFTDPYALASAGGRLAVWGRSGRLTVFRGDGSVAGTNPDLRGDAFAIFQRGNVSMWEEPFQQSREEITRRLAALPGGGFGLQLQDDERLSPDFLSSGEPRRFPHRVVALDSTAAVVDTLLRLTGQELELAMAPSSSSDGMAAERPYALRPLWTSGDGWIARGHGADTAVHVTFASGEASTVVWRRDSRPLTEADFDAYLDWELEGYRRVLGNADEVEEFSRSRWKEELREGQRSADRPQITGLLGLGSCLGLLGFAPGDSVYGESRTLVLVDVSSDRLHRVRLPVDPGFVRGANEDHVSYISVDESGMRTLSRHPLPRGMCSVG